MSAGKLKFLVDVGVGAKVEAYLIDNNYDIKTVRLKKIQSRAKR